LRPPSNLDEIRNASLNFDFGFENGSLQRMLHIGDSLYIFTENSIWSLRIPDEVDPDRE
jgi:hypothetical protein